MADVPTDDEALALDEITEVGPGGNFLARKYTRPTRATSGTTTSSTTPSSTAGSPPGA